MADPNEAGGWVIDPSNPNRATYTDETGTVHEAVRDVPDNEPNAVQKFFGATPETVERGRKLRQSFSDTYKQATNEGFGGQVANAWLDWTNAKKPELRKQFPGQTEDWYEQQSDRIISEARRTVSAEIEARQKADPLWKPDESFLQQLAQPEEWMPWLAANVLGSAGPESLINPGKSAIQRIGAQVAVGGLTDAVYQGLNIWEDVKDEYSAMQSLGAAAAAGGLQGVFEVPGFIKELFKARGTDTTPSVDPVDNPNTMSPQSEAQLAQYQATIKQMLDEGKSADDIRAYVASQGADPNAIKNLDAGIAARDAGREYLVGLDRSQTPVQASPEGGALEQRLADEANAFRSNKAAEPAPEAGAPAPTLEARVKQVRTKKADKIVDDAVTHINKMTADWSNAPKFEVVDDLKNLADKDLASSIDPDAIGVSLPDGRVIINMKNVDSPETLSAVTFHEALGHHGLAQKFGDDLDLAMSNLYEDANPAFKQKVDEWIASNPDQYVGPSQHIRATEEVLAEMSQEGRLDRSILDGFKNWLKDWGRQMGLTLKYSDREIQTILSMAHDATIKGAPDRSAASNGFKYAKVWHGSPHQFDQFDHSKMGAGEGHQAFGWGTYLAENDQVATGYRDRISARASEYKGNRYESTISLVRDMAEDFIRLHPHLASYKESIASSMRRVLNKPGKIEPKDLTLYNKEYLAKNPDAVGEGSMPYNIAEFMNKHGVKGKKGSLYEVEIPDKNFLLWDKSYHEQPEAVKKVIKKYFGDDPETEFLFSGASDGQDLYNALDIKLGSDKAASKALADEGVVGNKYLDQFSRDRTYDRTYNYVVFDEKNAKILNRYMMKRRPEGQKENVGAINPNKIDTLVSPEKIDEMLYELNAVNPNKTVSWDETEEQALARGLTPSRIAKRRGFEGASSYIRAANMALTQQIEKVANLDKRMETEGYSEALHEQTLQAMQTLRAVHARVNYDNSELGRALSILRKGSSSKEKSRAILEEMKNQGADLADPEAFMKYMLLVRNYIKEGNEDAAIKLTKDAFKPQASDYIFSLWYNMMLSSPATHVANFAGTGGHFLADLMANTGAAVTGQFKRGNLDRVRGREVAYRVFGALQALKSAQTWDNARQSLNTGLTGNEANAKVGDTGAHNLVISDVLGNAAENLGVGSDVGKTVGSFIEAPTRFLAGTDEWWRNVLQLSNIYGLAVRNAGNKGLKGKEFWGKVNELIADPTKEMLDATKDYTKVTQFLDKPSKLARTLISLQTTDRETTPGGKIAAGILKMTVPFVRTPDALIRSTLRWTPLGAFERENVKGWKAGGAERDKVKARLLMGSMISFAIAAKAADGQITGEGPSDPAKRQAWLATHQPNSIKVGGEWYSLEGLEPVSTLLTGIATLVDRGQAGDFSSEDYGKRALALGQGVGAVLTSNSYMENLNAIVDSLYGEGSKAESAGVNWAAGLASSATTPAVVRKYAQTQDPVVRDTTGDGSFSDRIEGRIKSGIPGATEELPAKYDVYGRPETREFAGPDIASRVRIKNAEESDPVIQEFSRLEGLTDKVLLGPPGKSNIKVNGVERRLTSEEYQKYQRLSGYWITEYMRQEMKNSDWQNMTDEQRIDYLKEVRDAARKAARTALFDPEDEDQEGDSNE